MPQIQRLSTGDPSTLGTYLKMCLLVMGSNSPATTFLRKKVAEAPMGFEEEVIAPETQMVYMLMQLHTTGLQRNLEVVAADVRIDISKE